MSSFIGRTPELKKLKEIKGLGRPCLVVIRGRRRIGKTRLIKEYAQTQRMFAFSGLAPRPGMSSQTQRDHFGLKLSQLLGQPRFTFQDWSEAFNFLSEQFNEQSTVVIFDEISWMAHDDATFVAKLKDWWDEKCQDYPNLTLVLCGSVSTWIEENIINSTALFGRISLTIDLPELSLPESYQLLLALKHKRSYYEIFLILSITGGIPWYIEQINPTLTLEKNIRELCFTPNGQFVKEYELIFHDLFDKKSDIYKKIINCLCQTTMINIANLSVALDYTDSGTLSGYLAELVIAGFVSKHYTWDFKNKKLGKRIYYRLKDNYLRFYLKYIQPELIKIENNNYTNRNLTSLSNWNSIMGIQIENLLLANRNLLIKLLDINPMEIAFDGPYLQVATKRHRGCQIDYLIQTTTQNLYLCEFKFNRSTIGLEVIEEMEQKINRLVKPRNFGIIPVLFHLGEIADSIYDKNYFYKIIALEQLLE